MPAWKRKCQISIELELMGWEHVAAPFPVSLALIFKRWGNESLPVIIIILFRFSGVALLPVGTHGFTCSVGSPVEVGFCLRVGSLRNTQNTACFPVGTFWIWKWRQEFNLSRRTQPDRFEIAVLNRGEAELMQSTEYVLTCFNACFCFHR